MVQLGQHLLVSLGTARVCFREAGTQTAGLGFGGYTGTAIQQQQKNGQVQEH
jgi:hypothetical protein